MKTFLFLISLAILPYLSVRAQDLEFLGPGDRSGGVGLALDVSGGVVSVAKVVDNSPAAASKQIHEGDRIIAVGEEEQPTQPLTGKSLQECVSLIRGAMGSQVRLTVLPQNAPESEAREVMLTRDDLQNPLGLALDAPLFKAGTPAPDLRYVRLSDGKMVSLADLRGKTVVLEFWATWCTPCQTAMADMQQTAAKLAANKDQVEFLTISIDGDADPAKNAAVLEKVRAHVKEKGWSQTTQGWSSLENRSNWHLSAVPTLYVIGPDGKITVADPREIDDAITRLLKSGGK